MKVIVTGLAHASQAGLRMPRRAAFLPLVHPLGTQAGAADDDAGESALTDSDEGVDEDKLSFFSPEVLFAAIRLNALLRDKSMLCQAVDLAVELSGAA